MKYIIAPIAAFTPPLGAVLPRKQDVQVQVPSGRTFGTLFGTESEVLPDNTEIFCSEGPFVIGTGVWYKSTDYSVATDVSVPGLITIRNNSDTDLGITW